MQRAELLCNFIVFFLKSSSEMVNHFLLPLGGESIQILYFKKALAQHKIGESGKAQLKCNKCTSDST